MGTVLADTTKAIIAKVLGFIPVLLGVILVLVIGWALAKYIVQKIAVQILKFLKVDVLSEKTGIAAVLEKGDIKYTLSELIGAVIYWMLMLIIVIASISILGIDTTALLDKAVAYLPNVLSAIFILILGLFLANILNSTVKTIFSNMGAPSSKALGKAAQVIILIFTIGMTFEQLGIATSTVTTIVGILVGSVGLAVGLAFGLGCKDIAGRFIQEIIDKLKK